MIYYYLILINFFAYMYLSNCNWRNVSEIFTFSFQCVFVDSLHNLIFITFDNGKTIQRIPVPFHPSEVSFYELDPRILIALDKVDSLQRVRDEISV